MRLIIKKRSKLWKIQSNYYKKLETKFLNQANIHDLVALNFEAQGFSKLGDKYKSYASEEYDFSQKLFNRILDLGGKICYQNQVSFEMPASPL